MNARFFMRRLVLPLLLIAGLIALSCIPERRAPPPRPPAPAATQPGFLTHDLAGRRRDPQRGVTPGALEAEEGPRPEPAKKPAKTIEND